MAAAAGAAAAAGVVGVVPPPPLLLAAAAAGRKEMRGIRTSGDDSNKVKAGATTDRLRTTCSAWPVDLTPPRSKRGQQRAGSLIVKMDEASFRLLQRIHYFFKQ